MSELVNHAKRELELIGERPSVIEGYLKIIQDFDEMGHSGASAAIAIPTLHRLLQFQNLTPLTNNPKEWNLVGDDMWQSARNPEAFSDDGGKHYYLLSEGGPFQNPEKRHKSEKG